MRIRIHKSTGRGVVETGLQVIQSRFGIVIISSVPQGIDVRNLVRFVGNIMSCIVSNRQDIAPGVIGIPRQNRAVSAPRYRYNIPLQILNVVIRRGSGSHLTAEAAVLSVPQAT